MANLIQVVLLFTQIEIDPNLVVGSGSGWSPGLIHLTYYGTFGGNVVGRSTIVK